MCCSVLQCVAVCCSVLQCVAVCLLRFEVRVTFSERKKSWALSWYWKHHNMVWLRLVGSLRLYVSFAKEPYKRDYILSLTHTNTYGVATISRLLKIIGLFCKRTLQKRRYSATETYDFKEPTNRIHFITEYTYASSPRILQRYSVSNVCSHEQEFSIIMTMKT